MTGAADRKADHLALAAGDGVLHRGARGLEGVRLRHRALPGRDLPDVDVSATLLGRRLDAPLLISAMTGGTPEAQAINDRLAAAAAAHGVAMSLGSARALLDDPALLPTSRPAHRPPAPPRPPAAAAGQPRRRRPRARARRARRRAARRRRPDRAPQPDPGGRP